LGTTKGDEQFWNGFKLDFVVAKEDDSDSDSSGDLPEGYESDVEMG
jgi:hypothetical protein